MRTLADHRISALIAVACALLAMCQTLCAQEMPPAGNEHPQTQDVSESDEQLAPPFGDPEFDMESRTSIEQKLAFAEGLDLEALRSLAVFHNGRVKILDTLSLETVTAITGRHSLTLMPEIDGTPTKVSFDPVFTLLDLVIDPGFYLDKPLFHVNFLPLREAFLRAAFPENELEVKRWNKLTRISPMMAEQLGPSLNEQYMFEPGYREALNDLRSAIALWEGSGDNMLLIAPATKDGHWRHLSERIPEDPEGQIRSASLDLGTAWRALDAEAANSAMTRLAQAVRKINPEQYPAARAQLERTYNSIHAFDWGMWIYFVSALSLVLAFATGRGWLVKVGIATLFVAIVLHAYGFSMRCVIAERFAIQNQYESMTGVSLFASLVGATLMVIRRQWLFGAAAAATGFLILTAATQTGIPGEHIEREAAILNTSVLLKYHVTTVLTSYGLITLGFIISLFLLGTHYAAKWNPQTDQSGGSKTKLIADLDKAQMTVLQLAFWTLGVGILLGAWWADHSWGRWWAFDPKETWALLTWIIYLIVIHVRLTIGGTRKAVVTSWLSVLGFMVMLWTYFGVNLLLPGLHAYA